MNATCNQQPCPGKNLTKIIYVDFFSSEQNTSYINGSITTNSLLKTNFLLARKALLMLRNFTLP